MATPNFKTMANFPLIVKGEEYLKICPKCHISNSTDVEKCECGCDLTEVEVSLDDCECDYVMKEMDKVAAELNDIQPFYTVTVESGYYSGIQFYVDARYGDVTELDNSDSQYEFGMCRSKMLRKFKVAGNKIRKALYKAKDALGLDELICTARFSNGEAWYSRVDTRKPIPLRIAAKAAIA